MVRESGQSSGVTLSSIALLQERFRQLQKMKELRQEKELMRLLSESAERNSPPTTIHNYNYHEQRSNTISGSEFKFLPPKPQHCQLGLSLRPDSDIIKQGSPSNRAKSWFNDAPIKLENSGSDIDTSLHL